ncbi:endonuclease II [Citrobacter phage CkP1]|nr:endonuclease II [Citrobacter phage CkP1]
MLMKDIANEYSFIEYTELTLLDDCTIDLVQVPNKQNVVYAISVDGELVYIGKTKNLRKRINYYRTAINRKDHTSDSAKSAKIYDALIAGKKVSFYARQCFNLLINNELGQMSVETMSLEEPMFIKKFNPPWNTQHKSKSK